MEPEETKILVIFRHHQEKPQWMSKTTETLACVAGVWKGREKGVLDAIASPATQGTETQPE